MVEGLLYRRLNTSLAKYFSMDISLAQKQQKVGERK